jgi:hypothetical protein
LSRFVFGKEAVVVYLEVIPWYLPRDSEENHEETCEDSQQTGRDLN